MAEGLLRPQVPTLTLSNPPTPSKPPKPTDGIDFIENNQLSRSAPALAAPGRVTVEQVTNALSALSLLSPRATNQRLFVQGSLLFVAIHENFIRYKRPSNGMFSVDLRRPRAVKSRRGLLLHALGTLSRLFPSMSPIPRCQA